MSQDDLPRTRRPLGVPEIPPGKSWGAEAGATSSPRRHRRSHSTFSGGSIGGIGGGAAPFSPRLPPGGSKPSAFSARTVFRNAILTNPSAAPREQQQQQEQQQEQQRAPQQQQQPPAAPRPRPKLDVATGSYEGEEKNLDFPLPTPARRFLMAEKASSTPRAPRPPRLAADPGTLHVSSPQSSSPSSDTSSSSSTDVQQFMLTRRQEWLKYLKDETLVLRVDRQNLILEKQKSKVLSPSALGGNETRARPSILAIEEEGEGEGEKAEKGRSEAPPPMTPLDVVNSLVDIKLPDFPSPRTPSTVNQERQAQAWKEELVQAKGARQASAAQRGTGKEQKASRSTTTTTTTTSSSSSSITSVRSVRKNKSSKEKERGELSVRRSQAQDAQTGAKSGAQEPEQDGRTSLQDKQRHGADFSSITEDEEACASSEDEAEAETEAESLGVQAANRAADAATVGKNRMLKMWDRMQRIMPAAAGLEPLQVGSSTTPLELALKDGEILSESRAGAWTAIACSSTEDPLLSTLDYISLLYSAPKLPDGIQKDLQRTLTEHSSSSAASKNDLWQLMSPRKPAEPRNWRDRNALELQEAAAVELSGGGIRVPTQKALFNLVKAYMNFDPQLGYCQGLGFISATILGVVGPEEDAFAVLVFLLHRCCVRGLLLPDMAQVHLRMNQLDQLVKERLPRLYGYFEDLELKSVMFAPDWFLTLFSRRMPPYLALRVIDIMLSEKTLAIAFKLSLILLQVAVRQLLQCPQLDFCLYFLKNEFPEELKSLGDGELEELVANAMRLDIPFETMLALEAEYSLLAGEAAAAAQEVQAAAKASEEAAALWEAERSTEHGKLLKALEGLESQEEEVDELFQEYKKLLAAAGAGSAASLGEHDDQGVSIPLLETLSLMVIPPGSRIPKGKVLPKSVMLEQRMPPKSPEALVLQVAELRQERERLAEAMADAEKQLMECLRGEGNLGRVAVQAVGEIAS